MGHIEIQESGHSDITVHETDITVHATVYGDHAHRSLTVTTHTDNKGF